MPVKIWLPWKHQVPRTMVNIGNLQIDLQILAALLKN